MCPSCNRYVCNGHWRPHTCTSCTEEKRMLREACQEEWEEQDLARKCFFCGKRPSDLGSTHQCAVCERYFCFAHGSRGEEYRPIWSTTHGWGGDGTSGTTLYI